MNFEEFENVKIPIVEIFQSISGEGISQGYVVTFVRVAGCNLRCSFCDTKYSYDETEESIKFLTPLEIYEAVKHLNCNEVLCTGGEPLESEKAKRYLPLYLAAKGLNVRIETNGSCNLYNEDEIASFSKNKELVLNYVLDVKTPSSQMSDKMIFEENYKLLKEGDELKFVAGSEEDLEFSFNIVKQYKDIFAANNIVINFSPVYGKISPERLVDFLKEKQPYISSNYLKVRLSMQIHKIIWEPSTKGV